MTIEKFRDIVGADHIFDAPDILEAYSEDHSFVPSRKPLAVIKPRNTNEIKQIIDLANETLNALIPTSSSFPKFHGDTIPSVPGIVVDQSELDRVLRVDRRNKIAVVEPGVTFGKLRVELEKYGMVPYTPLLPRSTKSVLASALEREPITTPKDHWDPNDPLAGGEVVLGDGHVQGFGDVAGRTKEEVEKGEAIPMMPLGPSSIGWLTMIQGAQGTLGIVRWASVHCRIKPLIQSPSFIAAQNLQDILPLSQQMLRLRFADELFILNAFVLANIISEEPEEIRRLRAALPPWMLFINVSGYDRYTEKEVEWKEEQVREAAKRQGLEPGNDVGGVSTFDLLEVLGKTADKDRRLRYKGSCQVLPFSTTLDKTPELAACIARMAGDHGYPSADLSIYIQPVIQGCHCDCEVSFPYEPEDKQEAERVKGLFMATAQGLSKIGAYYSRPYGMLADITYRDTGIVNALRKIKGILDPNDVMNPGKLCF